MSGKLISDLSSIGGGVLSKTITIPASGDGTNLGKLSIGDLSNNFANINLQNTGMLPTGILSAPSDFITIDSYSRLVIKSGITYNVTDGISNGIFKSKIVTSTNDLIYDISSHTDYNWEILLVYDATSNVYKYPSILDFCSTRGLPSIPDGYYKVVYNFDDNSFYERNTLNNTWYKFDGCCVGKSKFVKGKFTNLILFPIVGIGQQSGSDCVESYFINHDRTLWYRLWKSGWKEQGGQTPTLGQDGSYTVTFPIAFSNTVYTVELTRLAGSGNWTPHVNSRSTTSMYLINNSGAGGSNILMWNACGY